MCRLRSVSTGIALLLLFLAAYTPAGRACGDEPDPRAKLEALLEARARDDGFSGSVLVARDGEPIVRRGYGMANREHDVPNTPGTKFRIGSLTKAFTAAAVLLLQERGKLDVREKIEVYLPDCPESWGAITVHHLLTHTSGLPNYTRLADYPRLMRDPTTPDALLARFRDRPLEFAPGERFAYSNSGYAVLGRIVEEVSGRPYSEFLRESIFEPLGMADTGYDIPLALLKHRASGYTRLVVPVMNARYLDMTVPYAAGALYSTVDDLARWDRALATDQLLSKQSRDAMFTPALDHYGYGWTITRSFGRPMISHVGGINGFAGAIRRFPEDRVCVVVLSNVEGTPVSKLADSLAAIVFGTDKDPEARTEEGEKVGPPPSESTPAGPARRP